MCILIVAIALPVSASEVCSSNDYMPIALENDAEAGYIIEPRISGLPFTMTAKNITSFLSSLKSDKGFVPVNYLGNDICVRGTLYHSQPGGSAIRAGVCYYDASQGIYIPGAFRDVGSGQYFSVSVAASSLLAGTTYYGYIRNNMSYGSVNNGSITISAQ
jgi:hypothetical protein